MPITSAEITATIMSFVSGILILAISIKVLGKWREKRQDATLLLFFSNLAWVCACWSAMGIYPLAEIATGVAIVLQKCVYSFVLVGGMLMSLFGTQIFLQVKSKKWNILYIIAGILFITLIFVLDSVDLKTVSSGALPAEYGLYPLLSIKIEFGIILVLYLGPVLIGIATLAIRGSNKLEDHVYKVGYRCIAYGCISILAIFIVDALSTEAQGLFLEYTILMTLTWIFPIIAAFFCYIGWTLPQWFRGIFEKK